MYKELIERLRTLPVFDDTTIGNEAADAIEALQEIILNVEHAHAVVADAYGNILRERDTLRQQLAESQAEVSRLEPLQFRQTPCHKFCEATAFEIAIRNLKRQLAESQRDAETYHWLRDNSAAISWNPSRYNAEIVSGFSCAGTGYLGFSFESAIKEAMKGAA